MESLKQGSADQACTPQGSFIPGVALQWLEMNGYSLSSMMLGCADLDSDQLETVHVRQSSASLRWEMRSFASTNCIPIGEGICDRTRFDIYTTLMTTVISDETSIRYPSLR